MKKLLWVLLAVALVGWILYSNIQQQKAQDNKRTVYAVLPLTGQFASYGKDIQTTINAYMKQKNFDFQVKYLDSEGNPSKAITTIQQATLNDENPIVISAFSFISTPIAPVVYNKNGFLFGIITASVATDTNRYQRMSASAGNVVEPIAKYLVKYPKKTNLIYIQDEFAIKELEFIKEYLLKEKLTLNKEMVMDMSAIEVRNSVLKLLSDKPERVVLLGQPTAGYLNIIRELKAQDFKGEIFTDSGSANPPTKKALGESIENIFCPTLKIQTTMEQPQKVKKLKKMTEQDGLEMYISVVEAVDVIDLIQYTLEHNLPFTQDTYKKLEKWSGVSGDIHFIGNGQSSVDFYVLTRSKEGKFIPVESETK